MKRVIFYLLSPPRAVLLKDLHVEILLRYNYAEVKCTPIFWVLWGCCRLVGDSRPISNQGNVRFLWQGDAITPPSRRNCPAVRSYVENKLSRQKFKNQVSSTTWVQCSAMSVRAGRLRQFHQIGVECLFQQPATDGKPSLWQPNFLKAIGPRCQLHLNTLGNPWKSCGLSSSLDRLFNH